MRGGAVDPVPDRQQVANLLKCEPETLGLGHEHQPGSRAVVVAAVASVRTNRSREQPDPLVVPDRRRGHSHLTGHLRDLHETSVNLEPEIKVELLGSPAGSVGRRTGPITVRSRRQALEAASGSRRRVPPRIWARFVPYRLLGANRCGIRDSSRPDRCSARFHPRTGDTVGGDRRDPGSLVLPEPRRRDVTAARPDSPDPRTGHKSQSLHARRRRPISRLGRRRSPRRLEQARRTIGRCESFLGRRRCDCGRPSRRATARRRCGQRRSQAHRH